MEKYVQILSKFIMILVLIPTTKHVKLAYEYQ